MRGDPTGAAGRDTAVAMRRRALVPAVRSRGATVRKGRSRPADRIRKDGDRGSASVWVLAAGVVIVAIAAAFASAGSAIVARHQAGGAADLAALAGAAYVVEGVAPACEEATRVALANGGRLLSCQLDGWDVVVTVAVTPKGPAGLVGSARASARAGPVVA